MFDINVAQSIVATEENYVELTTEEGFTIYDYVSPVTQEQLQKYPLDILLELRGLCVADDGTVFPAMHKFFNCGEHEQYSCNTSTKFRVYGKVDGSLIMAFKYNGKLYTKTRKEFNSWQAVAAKEFLVTKSLDKQMEQGKVYLFEYVSPKNKKVIEYTQENLVLLATRNIFDFSYTFPEGIDWPGKKVTQLGNYLYRELKEYVDDTVNFEGWVGWSRNADLYHTVRQVKTKWYLDRENKGNKNLSS